MSRHKIAVCNCPICGQEAKQIPFLDSFVEDQDLLREGGWFFAAIDECGSTESVCGISKWECLSKHTFFLNEDD
jgi:hypothetical protein